MTDKELLQQALSWIEAQPAPRMLGWQRIIEAIRTRLAEPEEAEPVAWIAYANETNAPRDVVSIDKKPPPLWPEAFPVYRHRPAVKLSDSDILPLIDMEIEDYLDGGYVKSSYLKSNLQDFARAIENAVLKKNGLEVKDEPLSSIR